MLTAPYLPPKTVRQYNSKLMELFSLYMNLFPTAVDGKAVTELAEDCNIPLAEAFAHYLAALMELDAGGPDRLFFQHWLLPSIRELSATLSVNPNTIQKSYAELIRRGIIIPSPGSGTYVAPDAIEKIRHAAGSKLEQLEALVAELVLADVPRSDVLATVCAVYARSEKREPIPAPIPPTGGTQS